MLGILSFNSCLYTFSHCLFPYSAFNHAIDYKFFKHNKLKTKTNKTSKTVDKKPINEINVKIKTNIQKLIKIKKKSEILYNGHNHWTTKD